MKVAFKQSVIMLQNKRFKVGGLLEKKLSLKIIKSQQKNFCEQNKKERLGLTPSRSFLLLNTKLLLRVNQTARLIAEQNVNF